MFYASLCLMIPEFLYELSILKNKRVEFNIILNHSISCLHPCCQNANAFLNRRECWLHINLVLAREIHSGMHGTKQKKNSRRRQK